MAAAPLAERLAKYAVRLTFDRLAPEAIHEAKRRFIDSFATAVGAMPAEAYRIAKKCALRVSGNPDASILGGGRTTMIAEYIGIQVLTTLRWGLATMLASTLLITVFLMLAITSRFVSLRRLFGAA